MNETGPAAQVGQTFEPFRAVLHPNRSLSKRGFIALMSFLGVVSFVTGLAFYAVGAWPVLGFFGLDVLIVYIAFKLNYRAARAYETVEVTPEALHVARVSANGRREAEATFNPYWVRVLLADSPDGRVDLRLSSHGRTIRIAEFLSPDETRDFAVQLESSLAALKRVR